MKETRAGGDPNNNLYAVNSSLDKYDKVTGKKAREFEYNTHRKSQETGNTYAWWGHCNNASEAACILRAPKHDVVRKLPTGETVVFTPHDIQGLLVKVTPGLVAKVDFKGNRFNDPRRDDPNEPAPDVFLAVMQEWALEGIQFVLDIDRNEQVWNFPYDQVKISESTNPPQGFAASGLPTDGSVKYYHIEMSGTGFEAKKRVYECYVQRNGSNGVVAKGWIKTPNSHNNPDFMWRPHPVGDIMNKANWKRTERASNPEIDPQIVYDIYMESLA